jgi:hypothetical protein
MRDFRRPGRIGRSGPLVVGLLVAGALGACGSDAVAPVAARFDGAYALEAVDGIRLPATVADEPGYRSILLADTLTFQRDGIVARSMVYRQVSATRSPRDTVYHLRMTFPYTVEASRLTIGSRTPCPPNANCVGREDGTISASGVIVWARLFWSGEPVLFFRRLPDR